MKSRLTSASESEFSDGAAYYESEASNGTQFIQAVLNALRLLESFPFIGRPLGNRVRSYPIHKFPYSIIYHVTENEIVVISVAHQSRKPEYWIDRVSE